MFKTEVTRQTALSLTYLYGISFLSQPPLPQCVTYQDSSATEGCPGRVRQQGQTNSLHSWRRRPGGSACQQSCVSQVHERVPAQLLYGCAHSSPLQPKGSQQTRGSSCVQRNVSVWGAAWLSHRGQESLTQRRTTRGQKRTRKSLPSPITELTKSTLEEKKGNYFSSTAKRFTASDPIFPLPNRDRLKKLESDEMMLLS